MMMYIVVRHYTGPTTFSHEERFGPFSTITELDEQAFRYRNIYLSDVYTEVDGLRRRYSHQQAGERRRHG